ncbi:hypothetical protein M2281_001346 [Mesorhizobium soli]|uniref:hypothetical protein n=1 Tax=Pseudaminobacter soli (ex Li et al. 2025) TaxID=1295366 RepID=UPI0024749DC1|nr:hypothetical protein [Mesorhizobium soli]MDH6230774.1 hypothetical protein [Mesorhizobium soli]
MGVKKRKRAKNAKADDSSAARKELLRDAGGFDWGWPALEMVMANNELTRRLMTGGFSGCGYGVIPDGPPFISLFGDNLPGMKSALALMKEWTSMSGPNAIRIEIAYDGPGYVLAISQQIDLLRWRLSGIDTVRQPLIMVTSHIKRMDSRHPNLDLLADYAQQPVAPLWLVVGELPRSVARAGGSRSHAFTPQWDNAILLSGIDIYRQLSDRPADTMARTAAEFESRAKAGAGANWPPEPDLNPASVAATRERRLAASVPKTLHVLRNTDRGAALLAHGQTLGCAKWQVEQAICNLRSADFLAYQPSSVGKRLAMIEAVRNRVLETASMDVDFGKITNDQLTTQIALDAAYLLRRLEPDGEMPEAIGDRIRRVQELGYG